LKAVGLNPASIPLGLDLEAWLARAATPWDAFPNTVQGKSDAETTLSLALQHPNVTLMRNSRVERVLVDDKGYCIGVELERSKRVEATQVILAAGAVNTAALLLRSATEAFPHGLGNASDQVGRNFMNHNCSGLLALHPLRRNGAVYQKTLLVNDFYHRGAPDGAPLGNIQMLGKVSGEILSATSGLPRVVADWVAARSFDFYVMSEDLPNPDSRVSLRGDRIVLDWKRSNWRAHELLVARLKGLLKKAGFPLVLSKPFDRRTPSHQCGTARMGADPAASVVDSYGRSHDVPNLWIVDASVLPTSAAVNPALTIAALALRAGAKLREEMA
jgi:choline dehydrogenase-like flavoprotein